MVDLSILPHHLLKNVVDTRALLLPVLLCIALTQVLWVAIYGCTTRKQNIDPYAWLDPMTGVWTRLYSVSRPVVSALLKNLPFHVSNDITNSATLMSLIAVLSTLSLILSVFDFTKTVRAWLTHTCIVQSFIITGALFQDAAAHLPIDATSQFAIGSALTVVYGSGAMPAYFTNSLPSWCLQLYSITNSASLAIFFLKLLSGQTTWFLLAAMALWEGYTTLAPTGPLRLAISYAPNFDRTDWLRFTMIAVGMKSSVTTTTLSSDEVQQHERTKEAKRGLVAGNDKQELRLLREEAEVEESQEKDNVTSSCSQHNKHVIEHTHTYQIETTTYLGRNLFVACSILVGNSMALGLISALFTSLAVLIGIAHTLSIPALDHLPALPISIALGIAAHFATVAHMTAIEYVYNNYKGIE